MKKKDINFKRQYVFQNHNIRARYLTCLCFSLMTPCLSMAFNMAHFVAQTAVLHKPAASALDHQPNIECAEMPSIAQLKTDTYLICATHNGTITAKALNHPKPLWRINLDTPIRGDLQVLDRQLFLSTQSHHIIAIDLSAHTLNWQSKLHAPLSSPLLVTCHGVFIQTQEGDVHAFSLKNGRKRWQFHWPKTHPNSDKLLVGKPLRLIEHHLVATLPDHSRIALDPQHGRLILRHPGPDKNVKP